MSPEISYFFLVQLEIAEVSESLIALEPTLSESLVTLGRPLTKNKQKPLRKCRQTKSRKAIATALHATTTTLHGAATRSRKTAATGNLASARTRQASTITRHFLHKILLASAGMPLIY
ncbi:unnamed protein product [Caenorhabditis auriculariae]|uniref:Uncharacterized protein n=1 Tax=Caenorhabditis auriculariae TaxID=2777116 RepID=A0A8S1HXP6_9PELO|nr:unnamed protein product [Caenorhabditis auriculariae]